MTDTKHATNRFIPRSEQPVPPNNVVGPAAATDRAIASWVGGAPGTQLRDNPNFLITAGGQLTVGADIALDAAGAYIELTNAASYLSIGAAPADAGAIRQANTAVHAFRNAAGLANITGLTVTGLDYVEVGDGVNNPRVNLRGSALVQAYVGAALKLAVEAARVWAADAVAIGATPAQTGAIRLTNAEAIYSRNQPNTFDLHLIELTALNRMLIGQNSASLAGIDLWVGAASNMNFWLGAANKFNITATLVSVADALAIGNNPASTGILRLPNNQAVNFRNAGNTADLQLMIVDGSDNLILGTANVNLNDLYIDAPTGDYVYIRNNAVTKLTVGGSTVDVADVLAIGTNPASTGILRIPNNSIIYARNQANTGNVIFGYVDATDRVRIGANAVTDVRIDAGVANQIIGAINNVTVLAIDTNGVAIGTNPATTGDLRMRNTAALYWRNAANTQNILFGGVTNADNVQLGYNDANQNDVYIDVPTGQSIYTRVNAATVLTIAGALVTTAQLFNYGYAGDALGGGAGATLGTIGGTGPTAAAQNEWVKVQVNGVDRWIAVWA